MSEPITLTDIARLEVNPGDTLVVKLDRDLTLEQVDRLRAEFRRVMPTTRVLVLDRLASLAVVRDPGEAIL